MCVSIAPAGFSGTTLYFGEGQCPNNGHMVHVLGYQNTAVNHNRDGANALVLHFPARLEMTQENVVDTSNFSSILDEMVDAVRPPSRLQKALDSMSVDAGDAVHSFEHGIYHVVLSRDASSVGKALESVPEDKRPALNQELFDWYRRKMPGYSLALCCFNNRDAQRASPLLWWYEPKVPNMFMAPAIDCHTGEPPDLEANVAVDHWCIAGTNSRVLGKRHRGVVPVRFSQEDWIPDKVRALLPTHIMGRQFSGLMPNNDFLLPREDFQIGISSIRRNTLSLS